MTHAPYGSKAREYIRSAELVQEVAERQGIYYAIALLYDMQYDREDIKALLPILEKQKGAMK